MRPLLLSLLLLAGCPDPDTDTDDDTDTDTDVAGEACDPSEVPCVDDILLDLSLQEEAADDGLVTNAQDGGDWVTSIDATAGGYGNETKNPFVYLAFTDEGATQVVIDDDSALGSTEWHLAARRFIVRLNGGDSGPSCVGAEVFPQQTYEELTEVPDGVQFQVDDFYPEDCSEMTNDSSGLPGSPQVVLAPWWKYETCVKTSGYPFLIQLEDGRVLKMVVETYYESGQEDCNESGSPGSGSGNLTLRWQFME